MSTSLVWIAWALLGLLTLFAAVVTWRYWHGHRREQALFRLLEGADRLESRIKQCRTQLGQAHAAVRVLPGMPAAGSAAADAAIDTALRNLLAQRLWIRDEAPGADLAELDRVAEGIEQAGREIARQVGELREARAELDQTVRDLQGPA